MLNPKAHIVVARSSRAPGLWIWCAPIISVLHSLIRAFVVFAVTRVTEHFKRNPDIRAIVKQRHPRIIGPCIFSLLFIVEVDPREVLVVAMALMSGLRLRCSLTRVTAKTTKARIKECSTETLSAHQIHSPSVQKDRATTTCAFGLSTLDTRISRLETPCICYGTLCWRLGHGICHQIRRHRYQY